MSREGSHTALVVQNQAEQRDASALPGALPPPAGTLRLRGGPRNGPRVAWDEAVVDNEGLGRKKSKSTYLALEIVRKC
jgi:protein phosphatase 1 regulatory subunit 11